MDAVREMRDRSLHIRDTEGAGSASEAMGDREAGSEDDDGLGSGIAAPDRTNTGFSTTSAASSTSASMKSENARQKKTANLLAAATTATTAAKNWSWNALQNRAAKNAAGRRASEASSAPSPQEPMGRGQPLPPPGTPLPGPQREKSLWAGSSFGVPGLSGSMKRKPVLPKRPAERLSEERDELDEPQKADVGDEFGDWAENSGDFVEAEDRQSMEQTVASPAEESKKKAPPPLPKRRRTERDSAATSAGERGLPESTPTHALGAARLATATTTHNQSASHGANAGIAKADEADLKTATAQLRSSTSSSTEFASQGHSTNVATPPSEPTALPARAADPSIMSNTCASFSNSDPEDLVVVAAPVESGRSTPLPAGNVPGQERQKRELEMLPRYDGDEWGRYDDDDDEERYGYEDEDEDEDGIPKASFSRSRDDGFELHQ